MPYSRLRVLVVDDEQCQNDLLCLWLREMLVPDFDPVPVLSLEAAYLALASGAFDLALVDRCLGDGDGLALVRCIRGCEATRAIPVIIFSGLSAEKHVIDGLSRGADDYLSKPCTEELFRARVRAVLKRNREPATNWLMPGPGFELDPVKGRLFVDGRVEHLEPKEIELLLLLLRRPNVVHSAKFLCTEVWGNDTPARNTLESRLSSLRRKLGSVSDRLENVRGTGYRLVVR
ncbi:MAG TPA: response regulator transcription factor [Elusimicrobiota bacterium]|jgi:two-component system alkaline phosphatase synthesis response regulator PhoP|nr:response regulator transcription factor [Elusimicrobiota bacterium]